MYSSADCTRYSEWCTDASQCNTDSTEGTLYCTAVVYKVYTTALIKQVCSTVLQQCLQSYTNCTEGILYCSVAVYSLYTTTVTVQFVDVLLLRLESLNLSFLKNGELVFALVSTL